MENPYLPKITTGTVKAQSSHVSHMTQSINHTKQTTEVDPDPVTAIPKFHQNYRLRKSVQQEKERFVIGKSNSKNVLKLNESSQKSSHGSGKFSLSHGKSNEKLFISNLLFFQIKKIHLFALMLF